MKINSNKLFSHKFLIIVEIGSKGIIFKFISFANCSIFSMIKYDLRYRCENFCRLKKYTLIVLNLNNTDNNNTFITISEIYNKYRYSTILYKLKSLINQTLCIDN